METKLQHWQRPLWLALLVISSVLFSCGFACAAPLAGFGAAAALTLGRRDALYLMGGVWLANQAVGFLFLHYPWDTFTLVWGAIIGLAALLSMLAARLTLQFAQPIRTIAALLAAFVACEWTLYSASVVLGGTENYTLAIQGKIFALNAVALAGLLMLSRLATATGFAPAPLRTAKA